MLTLNPLQIACDLAVIDAGGVIPSSAHWPDEATWLDMIHARERVRAQRAESRERTTEIHRRPAFTLSGADYLTLIIVGASVVTAVGYTIVLLLRGDHPWWG